ncbi:MAG: hypothetical protein ACRCY9_17205 [Phycicoccus sp.]
MSELNRKAHDHDRAIQVAHTAAIDAGVASERGLLLNVLTTQRLRTTSGIPERHDAVVIVGLVDRMTHDGATPDQHPRTSAPTDWQRASVTAGAIPCLLVKRHIGYTIWHVVPADAFHADGRPSNWYMFYGAYVTDDPHLSEITSVYGALKLFGRRNW